MDGREKKSLGEGRVGGTQVDVCGTSGDCQVVGGGRRWCSGQGLSEPGGGHAVRTRRVMPYSEDSGKTQGS